MLEADLRKIQCRSRYKNRVFAASRGRQAPMTLDVFRDPRARISRFPTTPMALSFRTSRRFSSDGAGELRHQGAKTRHFTQVGISATFLRRDFRR